MSIQDSIYERNIPSRYQRMAERLDNTTRKVPKRKMMNFDVLRERVFFSHIWCDDDSKKNKDDRKYREGIAPKYWMIEVFWGCPIGIDLPEFCTDIFCDFREIDFVIRHDYLTSRKIFVPSLTLGIISEWYLSSNF